MAQYFRESDGPLLGKWHEHSGNCGDFIFNKPSKGVSFKVLGSD
jgi:hypothetical protein